MNNTLVLLGIILGIGLCELCGQSCLKYFNINNKIQYYIYGVIFYALVCFLLYKSYKFKGMGIINVLWSGLSILLILSISIIFFGEKITTKDKIGIVFIILGMIFILYEGTHPVSNVENFLVK